MDIKRSTLDYCFHFKLPILKIANVLVGNPVLCLDVEEKATFYHINTIETNVVIVDCDRLICDIDLRSFQCVEFIYLVRGAETNKFKGNF